MSRAEPSARDLALAMLWRVSPRVLRRLLDLVASGRLPFPWTEGDLAALGRGGRGEALRLPSGSELETTRRQMEQGKIRLLVRGLPGFPPELDEIPDPPPFLFTRGEPLAEERRPRVAVVGSRAASATGREIAYLLGRDLALAGLEVVSGMARGIDGEAHRGALDAGGRTVAVLGTGADVCYPPEHAPLLSRILRQGGVVTEFPPGTRALPLHFPRRNRVLTGLAQVLVVVEGGERSGARASADHAADQGREVMAVPRDIVHPGSALPNRLLRDGARPVLSVRDILEALPEEARRAARGGAAPGPADRRGAEGSRPEGTEPDGTEPEGTGPGGAPDPRATIPGRAAVSGPPLEANERRLLEALRRRQRDLEGCRRLLPGTEIAVLQATLARLEVMGWIRRHPGGRFTAADGR